MSSQLHFQITELRMQNIQRLLESIGLFFASLIVASLLPTLLITYVYTDQTQFLTQEPPFWVQSGPLVIFGVGVAYFVYVVLTILMRGRKIDELKQQLMMSDAAPRLSHVELAQQQAELDKLEKMVDDALSKSAPAKPKKTKKKSR